jgi:type IV pilus assembly protein PilA
MQIAKRSRTRDGFTLMELMIVVALIGTMAAIAIPNFLTYQARTRRSEAFTNLAGIARAYKVYHADRDRYPDMTEDTPALIGSAEASLPDFTLYGGLRPVKMPWDGATDTFFSVVGWRPDGNVFYTYDVESSSGCGGTACTNATCFTVTAHGDVDGHNGVGTVMLVHPLTNGSGGVIASCPSGIGGYTVPVVAGQPTYDQPAIRVGLGSDYY